MFEYLGERQIGVLGMTQFLPQTAAAFEQPGIEFGEGTETLLAGILGSFAGGGGILR